MVFPLAGRRVPLYVLDVKVMNCTGQAQLYSALPFERSTVIVDRGSRGIQRIACEWSALVTIVILATGHHRVPPERAPDAEVADADYFAYNDELTPNVD